MRLIAIVLLILLTGCSSQADKSPQEPLDHVEIAGQIEELRGTQEAETIDVSLLIFGLESELLAKEYYTVPKGTTAFDVIRKSGLNYTLEGGPSGSKIIAVGDLANTNSNGIWAWRLTVTGDEITNVEPEFVEEYILKSNDCVKLEYEQ